MQKPWENDPIVQPRAGGVVATPLPRSPAQERKDQRDAANTQSAIEDRNLDNARADRIAEIRARELELKEEKAALEREEAVKKAARETEKAKGKRDEVRYALRQLHEARKIAGRVLSTGIASEYVRGVPFVGQSKVDLEKALETPFAQIMQTKMAELAEANDGGVSRLGDTPAEVQRMAAAVANLGTEQSAEQLLEQIDRAENYFLGIAAQYEGADSVTPEVRRSYLPEARLNERTSERLPGFSPSAGPNLQSADDTYSTPQDLAVRDRMQQVYNAGGTVEDMAKVARDAGYPVNLQNMQEWARAIDYRDARGEYEGQRTGFSTVTAPQSGRRSLMGQMYGDFARTDPGSMAVAGGIGAANAVTLGGIDEITGAVNSIGGGSLEDEIAYANLGKQAAFDAAPGSALFGELAGGMGLGGMAAKAFPKAIQVLGGSTPRIVGTGSALGATTGALEMNDNRDFGAGVGLGLGALGGALGARVAAPAADAAMRTGVGQSASRLFRSGANRLRPGVVAAQGDVPQFAQGERLLGNNEADLSVAISNLDDAARLGVPYSLADATPELRALAGSVSRKSTNAGAMAESIFEPRARAQADRLVGAVDERLAPITDIEDRARAIMSGANIEAGPYYRQAKAKNAVADHEISSILESPTGQDALKRAYRIAGDEGRNPTEMGFVLDPDTGRVSLADVNALNEGRYSNVVVGNPAQNLTQREINGVPHRGPLDLVGFIRSRGGLRDNGGELRAMGLDNRSRSGDFVGQETRFGPLVAEDGMTFDDAARAAWEAGYFPGLTERPSINQFLDAFRETADGVNRRFTLDDMPEVEAFQAARQQQQQARAGRFGNAPLSEDMSGVAGPRDAMPRGREVAMPTFETLHYVRQGLDSILNERRDQFGKLDFTGDPEGRAIQGLRNRLGERLRQLNPEMAQGDRIYSAAARRREALQQGFDVLPRTNVPQRNFDRQLNDAQSYDADFRQSDDRLLPEMQRGYATRMADTADRMRSTANPWEALYGSPLQREKVGAMFPEGAADFGLQYSLERDMAKTAHETLGGSPTARRLAADEQFSDNMGDFVSNVAADAAGGGGMFTARNAAGRAMRMVGDNWRVGASQAKADAIAPILYDVNPAQAAAFARDYLDRIMRDNTRRGAFRRRGGLFGAVSAPMLMLPSE